MPTPPVPVEALQEALDTWAICGKSQTKAAAKIGISISALTRRLVKAKSAGLVPRVAPVRYGASYDSKLKSFKPEATKVTLPEPVIQAPRGSLGDSIFEALRRGPLTLAEVSQRANCSRGQALDELEALQESGRNVREAGGKWVLDKDQAPAFTADGDLPVYTSRPDNTFLFGLTSDNHLGSKYERLDVLNDLYDRFAKAGVDRVFNCGNWIDGEARFNKFDLHTHGMDAQLAYLAKHYPRRDGITTYAVAGDDHEGWYGQREGVDIGRYAERVMRENGRTDWVNLGYMEAHVRLVNAGTGKSSIGAFVHPGGGSAYALSYSIQKIIESLDGGEKPAFGAYGHYHKIWAGNIRNVWVVQTGCTEDQTPFMRKRRIEAHVGGAIVELEQDPRIGSIVAMTPKLIRYFNKGYYNDRWSYGSDVTLPEREAS